MSLAIPSSDLTFSSQQLTGELASALQDTAALLGRDNANQIARVLAFAASAEQHMMAQQARIAELEALHETDELTGLPNRRGFMRAFQKELENARRHGDQGLLAYLDLDGFKAINDTHGHRAGDKVLAAVGKILRDAVRETDCVARLGGDEFAIILTRSEILSAKARSDEIRNSLEEMRLSFDGAELSVGVSIGYKPYGAHSEAEALLHEADLAMYRAKKRRQQA